MDSTDNLLGSLAPAATVNNNTAFFSTAISPLGINEITFHLAMGTDAAVEYTLDNATTWLKFNSGNPLVANCGYTFVITANPAHRLNLRQTSGNTVTIKQCEVYG